MRRREERPAKAPRDAAAGRLHPDRAVLALIDVQGRLAELMWERETLYRRLELLIRGWRALGLPLLVTEQLPEKIGGTVPELARWIEGLPRIAKSRFSCRGVPAFDAALAALGRDQVLLAGIEAHICVWQTAGGLLEAGYEVFVAVDGISSRRLPDRETALRRILAAGGQAVTVEMALFEIMQDAAHPAFREVLGLVK